MAGFVCDHCKKCCRSFGAFFTSERTISDRDFYVRYHLTHELFPVHISAEYPDAFSHTLPTDQIPGACPLLRKDPEGAGYICTIYATRLRQCRDVRSYHLIIRDARRAVCGKVKGRPDLTTTDETFALLWKSEFSSIPARIRQHAVGSRLAAHGISCGICRITPGNEQIRFNTWTSAFPVSCEPTMIRIG